MNKNDWLNLILNILALSLTIGVILNAKLRRGIVFATMAVALMVSTATMLVMEYDHQRGISHTQEVVKRKLHGHRWTFDTIYSHVKPIPYETLQEALFHAVDSEQIGSTSEICSMNDGTILATTVYYVDPASAQATPGTKEESLELDHNWRDLHRPVDFSKGDKLRLTVGGSAEKILVRLLPDGRSPATSVGIVGGPIDVPNTRNVEITLPEDRKQVIRISVHGGPHPWNEYDLGSGNGPASIEAVELIEHF